jgi:hypothetical protein
MKLKSNQLQMQIVTNDVLYTKELVNGGNPIAQISQFTQSTFVNGIVPPHELIATCTTFFSEHGLYPLGPAYS